MTAAGAAAPDGVPPMRLVEGGLGRAERGEWGAPDALTVPVAAARPVDASDDLRADSIVEIYQLEHLGLFRYVRATVTDDAQAEDVIQEAFFRLVREVSSGRLPSNVHAWLYRVASNLVVSQVRRAQTAQRHRPELAGERLAPSPEQHVLAAERDDAVRSAVDELPVDARMALFLAAQGFTGHEIALTLGRSDGAVRTLLSRSRLRLRERLEPYGRGAVGGIG